MKTPTARARSLLLHLLIASLLTTMETLQTPTVEPTSPVLFQYVGEAQVTYRDWIGKGDELPITLSKTGGSGLARARGHVKSLDKRMGEAEGPRV